MAKDKKSFVLYSDLLKSIEHLTNEEKGILFNHLLEYVNDLNPVLEDRLILTAWKPIELQLKRDLIKFEEVKAKRSKAGKKSAEVRKAKSAETDSTHVKSVKQRSTNLTDNVTDNVNDNVINTPTFKEFLSYAKSKKENVSAMNLKLKYDSWVENGWKDGNNKPIKNWKSKLLNTIPYIEVEKIDRDNEGKNWGKGHNQLRN